MTMWRQSVLNLVALPRDPQPPHDLGPHGAGLEPRADPGAAKSSPRARPDRDNAMLVLGPAAAIDGDRLHLRPLDMVGARRAVAPQAFDADIALADDPEGTGYEVGISVNRECG